MYQNTNVLEWLIPEAEKFIIENDRMLYEPFLMAAEKFCSENSILIGGRVGIDLIIGRPYTKDSFVWDLYSDDAFAHAKQLSIILSNVKTVHVPTNTVAMRTDIKYKEFTISIHARYLFKIYVMEKYRGVNLISVMSPVSCKSYFSKLHIKCINEEILLIEIYRTLYSPAKVNMWLADYANEKILYNGDAKKLGEETEETDDKNEKTGGKIVIDKYVQQQVLKKYIANSTNVIIGDHATTALGYETNATRIQFITDLDIEEIKNSIERIVQKINTLQNTKITFIKYLLNIPTDFQIIKYTLYVVDNGDQTPIADVFNSSQYELIPFTMGSDDYKNIKIGNQWVLLRFLFIDIWTLRLILNLNPNDSKAEFIKSRIRSNLNRAELIHTKIKSKVDQLFQMSDYVGIFIDENIAKKQLIKKTEERFPVFYPAKLNLN